MIGRRDRPLVTRVLLREEAPDHAGPRADQLEVSRALYATPYVHVREGMVAPLKIGDLFLQPLLQPHICDRCDRGDKGGGKARMPLPALGRVAHPEEQGDFREWGGEEDRDLRDDME